MKTLVIHPDDRSTDFLRHVYENIDCDVITDCSISKKDLYQAIKEHDRILMMGHGIGTGLLNPKSFRLLIDDSFADLLRTKDTVSIWCYSDKYFRRNHIPGFHTGMIISEVSEAWMVLDECPLTKEELLDNMTRFATIIGECINMSPKDMQKYVLAYYTGEDSITQFNRKSIYVLS